MSNKKKVVAPKGISNIDDSLFAHLKDQDTLQAAAAILREEILGITKTKLPDYLTSQRLIKGECSTPPMISDFFFVNSWSSRKVIDIINHYGHCISYNAIEELETEATYSSVSRTGICPEAVNKNENLSTGMAFDNFDRFVDTKNGKDTLHDTVGIIYQNIDPNFEEEFVVEEEEAGVTTHNKRRRRSFETIEYELPQCAKKLKKTTNIQAENEEEVNIIVHKESLRSDR
ncbi:uncharacterized protein TNCV_1315951 [Trichonephila clavipes]|nr:uncharacterized protein TNCV_1315951 [Trichonephila clavipes]